MIPQLREMAKSAGRDPASIEVIVRANVYLTPQPLSADRWIFAGSLDQVKTDVEKVRSLGANELVFDLTFSPDGENADAFLTCMERVRKLA